MTEENAPGPLVARLLDHRFSVLAIDAFRTGELAPLQRDESPYDFLAFNRTDTALRVQDILTAIAYLKTHAPVVHLVGLGLAGLWALLARGLTSDVALTIADAARFDYDDDNQWVESLFIPHLRRAGDLRTAAALARARQAVYTQPVGQLPCRLVSQRLRRRRRIRGIAPPTGRGRCRFHTGCAFRSNLME